MQPTQSTLEHMVNLMAADTTLLADADEMLVKLVVNAFTPELATVLGDLTLASFTGSAPKEATAGAQTVAYDVATGEWFIQILEPAGGWTWVCTAAPGSTQTVYGFALTDSAGTLLIGTALLPDPIPINNVGDSVVIGYIRFRFLNTSPY